MAGIQVHCGDLERAAHLLIIYITKPYFFVRDVVSQMNSMTALYTSCLLISKHHIHVHLPTHITLGITLWG